MQKASKMKWELAGFDAQFGRISKNALRSKPSLADVQTASWSCLVYIRGTGGDFQRCAKNNLASSTLPICADFLPTPYQAPQKGHRGWLLTVSEANISHPRIVRYPSVIMTHFCKDHWYAFELRWLGMFYVLRLVRLTVDCKSSLRGCRPASRVRS